MAQYDWYTESTLSVEMCSTIMKTLLYQRLQTIILLAETVLQKSQRMPETKTVVIQSADEIHTLLRDVKVKRHHVQKSFKGNFVAFI